MRIVVQRVVNASVTIDGKIHNQIDKGLLLLIGIEHTDTEEDLQYLVKKTTNLRIFDDENGVMNRSINEVNGAVLAISQFTLMAATQKGNRPSYIRAARPEVAAPLYDLFCDALQQSLENEVKKGVFGADMKIGLINDGPVTIIMDSQKKDY